MDSEKTYKTADPHTAELSGWEDTEVPAQAALSSGLLFLSPHPKALLDPQELICLN